MLKKFKRIKPKKSESPQYIVGLDIGTQNIKALIGKIMKDGSLKVMGVGRAEQRLTDMKAGAIADIASVVANCNDALAKAESMAGTSARGAVIGIAGELVKGITITVRIVRKNPAKSLDVNEMDKIIAIVQDKALEKAKKQLGWELGGKDIGIRLVNSALVSVKIDEHFVSSPIGFTGKEMVIQLYTAFAPMVHIGAIERVANELDLELLAVAAEPFAVARSVVGDDPDADASMVLVDIGAGTTDIAVLDEGGLEGTKMFGIGGRAYTKSIERDLAISFNEAEKVKLSYEAGEVSAKKKEKLITDALQRTLDVWVSGVELALGEFDGLDNLPPKILMCGGGSSLSMTADALKSTKWYKTLPFTRKPVVELLSPDKVSGIIDNTGNVIDHTYITALGLLRVGLDTIDQSTSSGSIRDKFSKILSI